MALGGLTACGDKVEIVQPTTTPTGKDSSVTSVTVTPSTAQIQVGGTQTFVASVVGGPDLTNRNVTWSSSNTAVADVSASGVATAKAAGQTTIIAKSAANSSVQGAAVLTVTAIAPASLSFFGVNNQFGNPATLNNANGQLNVIANVDPGQSGLTTLQLLLICPKTTGTGSDTTVVGSSNVAGTTGSQTGQQVTIPFNTAAFNQATGAANYRNGTCSLSLRGQNAAGAQVISATGPQLTLNNADVVAGTIVGARNATDQQGLRWDGGAVTVTVLPVLYSGQTPATINVTINGTDTDGAGALAVSAAATKDANGVWTATFTEGTTAAPAAPAIGNVYTIPALTATITGVNTVGQPISGGAMAVNTVPTTMTGAPVAASIRYDNEDPTNPTYTFATQNPNYAAGAGFINSSYAFNGTMTAGQGFGGLGAAGATCVATSNGTLCDHQGVDKVLASYGYTTANPAAAGSSYTAITTASAIPETSSGTAYGFRVQSCDALNNCASLVSAERFGVDITTPVITNVAAPANNEGATTPGGLTNGGNLTITAVDSASAAGVTGSGFGATPVTGTLTRIVASGAAGQKTECVNILTGATSAVPAAGCPSQTFGFGQALPAGTIDDAAEYTLSYSVSDMAGNVTATGTRKFQVDAENPTVTGGISIPATVTAGTSFSTSASDSTDIATSAGAMEFTTLAVRIVQPATANPTGVIGDGSLTRASTITYTPSPFYGQLQQFTGANTSSAADNLDQVRIRARDVIGNTSADQVVALPAANVTTGTAFSLAANGIQNFTVSSSNATIYNGAAATPAGRSTTTNLTAAVDVGASTGASPFANVCFYYQSNGGAGQGGAVAGEWVLIGCQSAAAVTQVGANRVFNYTWSNFDPAASFPAGAVNVVAIGSNGNAGLISTAGAATITP